MIRYVRAFAGAAAMAALLGFAGSAGAAPLTCSVNDAMANGEVADECARDDAIGANPSDETSFVNTNFQDGGSAFLFADKTGENSSIAGWITTVTSTGTADPYLFDYTVTVPAELIGTVVDFVLVVKQNSANTVAYLFNSVTLGINGGFNNFVLNGADRPVNGYSHASALFRTAGTTVPEPTTVLLIGSGLLGLAALRRRRKN